MEGTVSVPSGEDAVVHRQSDKGFFKCFGCGAGGDVIKFVELHQKVSFPEAVRLLAQPGRACRCPRRRAARRNARRPPNARRWSSLHEEAVAFYREQLGTPGRRAVRGGSSRARGLAAETIETFGYGYAPAGRARHAARPGSSAEACR